MRDAVLSRSQFCAGHTAECGSSGGPTGNPTVIGLPQPLVWLFRSLHLA